MELPLDAASFESIVCGDLVEHLRNPGRAIERLRPFLRPGGRLVLSTPTSPTGRSGCRSSAGAGATPTAASSTGRTSTCSREGRSSRPSRRPATGCSCSTTRHPSRSSASLPSSGSRTASRGSAPRSSPTSSSSPQPRGDLGRHPRQGRRADLVRCLDGIAGQEVDEEVEVVVVDSGSTDGSADVARNAGATVHEIPAAEFGHGRTRNLGAGSPGETSSSSPRRTPSRQTAPGSRRSPRLPARPPTRRAPTAGSCRIPTPGRRSGSSSTSSTGRSPACSGSRRTRSSPSSRRCSRT